MLPFLYVSFMEKTAGNLVASHVLYLFANGVQV